MAVRNILVDENPRLRKKSKQVKEINPKILELLDDLTETMHSADGVGLAAPQVGILKRVVVIDVGEGPVEFINPEITDFSGKQIGEEGCLSLPDRSGIVVRPMHVTCRYQDRTGAEKTVTGSELLARAICHELDHLDGVLYIDKTVADSMDDLTDDEIEEYLRD